MTLVTPQFGIFATCVLVVYYLLPRKAQNVLLLVSSYAFYATWAWQFVLILVWITAVDFYAARNLQRGQRVRLSLFIGLNLLTLFLLKYADPIMSAAATSLESTGLHISPETSKILFPVGLSYYVLQGISYLVDVYRGQCPPSASWVEFSLYMAYFPRLLSGPIERARSFLPKLSSTRVVDNQTVVRGFSLIVLGLFRKLIIADTIWRLTPKDIFSEPQRFSAPELIIYLFSHLLYVYNDFVAYMSIARGVSHFFGIDLSRNFNLPLYSRSFTELWNRWHITLSHWLRDYVFYPVTRWGLRRNRNPRNVVNLILPSVITMCASGIWHGATFGLLLWGFLNGLFLVAERVVTLGKAPSSPDLWPPWRRVLGRTWVLVLTALALPLFRLDQRHVITFYESLSQRWDSYTIPGIPVFIFMLLSCLIDFLQHRAKNELFFLEWKSMWQSLLLALVLLAILLASLSLNVEPFVYQGF